MRMIDELLITCFEFLPYSDLISVSSVCKHWYSLAQTESIWKCICEGELKFPVLRLPSSFPQHLTPKPPQLPIVFDPRQKLCGEGQKAQKQFPFVETTWKLLYHILQLKSSVFVIRNSFLKKKKLAPIVKKYRDTKNIAEEIYKDPVLVCTDTPLYECFSIMKNELGSEFVSDAHCIKLEKISMKRPDPLDINNLSESQYAETKKYDVWMQNNDNNSFDEVVDQLQKINLKFEDAEIITWKAHTMSEAICYTGSLKECVNAVKILGTIGLNALIRTQFETAYETLKNIFESGKCLSIERQSSHVSDSSNEQSKYLTIVYRDIRHSINDISSDIAETCEFADQRQLLRAVYFINNFGSYGVFCGTKEKCERISNNLKQRQYNTMVKKRQDYIEEMEDFEEEILLQDEDQSL